MNQIGNQPPASKAGRQAGASVIAFAAVAFVAVGAVAWIGLDAASEPENPKLIYSSAPPQGTASQMMMALKVPRQRENEKARLAMLNDEDGPMVVKPLEGVVALTQIDRAKDIVSAAKPIENTAQQSAAVEVEVVTAAVEPETPSTTQAAVVAQADSCVDDLRNFAANQTILFGTGSAELQGSELPTLRKIGKMAEGCAEAVIHVTGHSDTSGSDIINLALSWQRADNTVAALAALGVDTAKFEPVGFGARSPSAQGDSSDEELNRRVEFVVFEEAGHSN